MKALGTFCEFKYGKSLPDKSRNGGEFPVYGSNGIVGHHDVPLTSGPTIIIGRKGSAGALQYSPVPCCPIDTTYFVDQTCTEVDLRWLFFTLQNLGLENLNKHVAVPGLNRNDAYEKELHVPPLDEQKRIAAVLDKADALRRQRNDSLKLTEKLLQSVFIDMFGDPLTNSKNLPLRKLGTFGIVQTGNTPPRSNRANYAETGLEWIKTDNIIEDQVIVSSARENLSPAGAKIARIAQPGSLLVACIAGSEKSIGRAALTDRKVAFNQQINAITPHTDSSPLFLYFLLKIARRQIQMAAGKGMKKMINKSTFEGLEFIAPEYDQQREFERVAQRMIEQQNDCLDQLLYLERFFSSLQQRAFRGELDLNRLELVMDSNTPPITPAQAPALPQGRYNRPGSFIAQQDIEAQMMELEEKLDFGKGDAIPWDENYFKYRILSQVLQPPYSFAQIWEEVKYDIDEPDYETVKEKVFEYVRDGILRQRFCKKSKEIVFFPNRK